MTRDRSVVDALEHVTGALADGGESRPGQVKMAEAVARAIEDGRHLAVAAGTGTGKSLAYLVPAVLSGHRVVVATATKALQDQLAAKDVPLVQRALRPFSFAVLKGRSNYVCRQRLQESVERGAQGVFSTEDSGSERASSAKRIVEWASRTRTGDRAELEEEPDPAVWGAFSVSAEECPGAHRCPSGASCFAELAKEHAAQSEVIAINHHLLGADLASFGAVLPEHDVLVVDEAHALEDTVTDSLGIAISPSRIRAVAVMARAASSGANRGRDSAIDALFEAATSLENALDGRSGERLVNPLDPDLRAAIELARTRSEALDAALGIEGRTETGADDAQPALRAVLASARLREDVDRFLAMREEDVAWIEESRRQAIRVAPIDVASLLSEQLFSTRTVVLTSATITPGLGPRLGADPENVDELDVGSPFDYEGHALLYCAAHLPDRRSSAAEAAIHDELCALIDAAGGRTLALFTSLGAMRRAADAMRPRVSYPLLVQGELAKPALVERFANEHGACLFATMGFWQGVDVPGETLSLVVIDRIPFPRPDEPLVAARRERAGKDAFFAIDIPRAASLLAQGAGRLIRSASDRGVVAVLDPRLATASYRWTLVRALPPMRRTKVRAEAEAFLRSLRSLPA
ncbi:MAG: ATP-dependent DNA helicase [Acidimicrobiales bacterium]